MLGNVSHRDFCRETHIFCLTHIGCVPRSRLRSGAKKRFGAFVLRTGHLAFSIAPLSHASHGLVPERSQPGQEPMFFWYFFLKRFLLRDFCRWRPWRWPAPTPLASCSTCARPAFFFNTCWFEQNMFLSLLFSFLPTDAGERDDVRVGASGRADSGGQKG